MKEKEIIKSELCNILGNMIVIFVVGFFIGILVFLIMVSSWKNFRISEDVYCQENKKYVVQGNTYDYPQTKSDKEKCEELKNKGLIEFAIEDGQNSYWICLISIVSLTLLIGIVYYRAYFRCEVIVTNKRIYGKKTFGKKIELPIKNISFVETSGLKGVTIRTASKKVVFRFVKNNELICQRISQLL